MEKRYIYHHFNPQTNQLIYVGVGYGKRAWNFKWGRNKHYRNYVNKYGEPIVKIILEDLPIDEAYKIEQTQIKEYGRLGIDPGGILLNKSIGGKTSALGNKQYITQEWKDNISKANIGRPKHTKNSKQKIRDKNSKPIIQTDTSGNIIKEWDSIKQASDKLGIPKYLIYASLQNPLNKTTDYVWKYKNTSKPRKGKSIEVYDFEWNFIKKYDSINQAERDLNIIGIRNFLKGKSKYVGKNKYKFKLI